GVGDRAAVLHRILGELDAGAGGDAIALLGALAVDAHGACREQLGEPLAPGAGEAARERGVDPPRVGVGRGERQRAAHTASRRSASTVAPAAIAVASAGISSKAS